MSARVKDEASPSAGERPVAPLSGISHLTNPRVTIRYDLALYFFGQRLPPSASSDQSAKGEEHEGAGRGDLVEGDDHIVVLVGEWIG